MIDMRKLSYYKRREYELTAGHASPGRVYHSIHCYERAFPKLLTFWTPTIVLFLFKIFPINPEQYTHNKHRIVSSIVY